MDIQAVEDAMRSPIRQSELNLKIEKALLYGDEDLQIVRFLTSIQINGIENDTGVTIQSATQQATAAARPEED